ncbi:hypothetical protein RO3G_07806 [Lichtheimia corymbifera JMRC:FSU:9682]|uniref:LIM-domain binding protein-domain-containing protein n=1 Tax=Lichtheimia corymbifera JMRC:FSU:9682 TaxID=1263082 RepID=A0A068S2V2_9FUNG|nr:hypothetical protein RO3G_07806 [Lichtheimia corymbifera JMRC:FSU:9682]
MSTGALPTPQQQLPAQLAQHHQTPPPLPQTPHVQQAQPVSTQQQQPQQPPVPMQQLQGHAQYQVQQFFHQRQRMMMYHQQQQAAAAAAARSGAGVPPPPPPPQQVPGAHQLQAAQQPQPPHPATQQQQQHPSTGVGMAAVQQEMSPQPAALPNGQPNTKPGVLPPQPSSSSMQYHHHQQQQKPAFVMEPQRLQSSGQAVLRLLEFADMISPGEQATTPAFWYQFVDDFFATPNLWPTIARFFLQQYTCQVSSIQMTLERLNESFKADDSVSVDCPRASLIHRYQQGDMVISTGSLNTRFRRMHNGVFKIEWMEFKCSQHEEYMERTRMAEILANTPKSNKAKAAAAKNMQLESPVNEWGVPGKMYDWLKMAEMMGRMDEVIFHAMVTNVGPRESLNALAYEANMRNPEMTGANKSNGATAGGGVGSGAAEKKAAAAAAAAAAANPNSNTANETAFATSTAATKSPVVKTQHNAGSATNTPMQSHNQLPLSYNQSLPLQQGNIPTSQQQQQQHQMMLRQQQLFHQQQQAMLQQQQHMATANVSMPPQSALMQPQQQQQLTAYPQVSQVHQPGT